MTEQKAEKAEKVAQRPAQELPQPLRAAASVLGKVPGAGMVGRVAEGTLDKVGAVSPRGRRLAVYTGAGVLGVAGVVEWPVAITGAAVAWLTQPRGDKPQEKTGGEVRAVGGTEAARAAGDAGDSGVARKTSGEVPTPKVMASSGHGSAVPDTPSDKLPAHHTETPATTTPGTSD
jgi:hypothetical protein